MTVVGFQIRCTFPGIRGTISAIFNDAACSSKSLLYASLLSIHHVCAPVLIEGLLA